MVYSIAPMLQGNIVETVMSRLLERSWSGADNGIVCCLFSNLVVYTRLVGVWANFARRRDAVKKIHQTSQTDVNMNKCTHPPAVHSCRILFSSIWGRCRSYNRKDTAVSDVIVVSYVAFKNEFRRNTGRHICRMFHFLV